MGWEYCGKDLGSASSGTFQYMWYRLRNIVQSLETYSILSPDREVRRQVNRELRDRPTLDAERWFETFFQSQGVTRSIAIFAYRHLGQYSGIQFEHVLPSDRLEEDLRWTQICWFDWEMTLCDDFLQCFGVDIADRICEFAPMTIADLVLFLNEQLVRFKSP
jgi:hypothetical protein